MERLSLTRTWLCLFVPGLDFSLINHFVCTVLVVLSTVQIIHIT